MTASRPATHPDPDPVVPPHVTLAVDYEGADDFAMGCAEHASSGGMFLSTDQVVDIGAPVRLVFSFPGLHRPVACTGVVRYRRAGRGGTGPAPGLGIELVDGGERERLVRVVDRVRARDPRVVARLVRVLVVEDNPHVAQLIRNGLQGSGRRAFGQELAFNFCMAQNGREALELLFSERFDALIIDIYLPVLDGVNVIARVRADDRLRALPIIAVSAGGDGAQTDAFAAGADRFLHKPMRLREVLDAMRELVPLEG